MSKRSEDPTNWPIEEKLRILAAAAEFEGKALDEFLCHQGVDRAQLEDWRAAVEAGFEEAEEQRQAERRAAELEEELRKKERELREMEALLVLQEKARAIWGDEAMPGGKRRK